MSSQQFEEYLEGSPNLSDRSKQMYRNQYNKFAEMNKNLITQSQANIIDFVDKADEYALNTKLAMLNVAVNLRKFYGKEVNKINNRKLQIADDYAQEKEDKKCDKLAELPTAKQLIAHENRLYLDGNCERFFQFGVIFNTFIICSFFIKIKNSNIIIFSSWNNYHFVIWITHFFVLFFCIV